MTDLDQALDTAASALAGFMCRHEPPCECTRDRLSELVVGLLPSNGDVSEMLTTSHVTVTSPGQGGTSTPVPELGHFETPEYRQERSDG